VQLLPDDELIAAGPDEGRAMLAEIFGWTYLEDDESGEYVLEPLAASPAAARH
jgi:hypothetical protein